MAFFDERPTLIKVCGITAVACALIITVAAAYGGGRVTLERDSEAWTQFRLEFNGLRSDENGHSHD